MSGTSLDGLDIAFCKFLFENEKWRFELLKGSTINYDDKLKAELKNAIHLNDSELLNLHHALGNKFAGWTLDFIQKNKLNPDLISSHGHTVFHDPAKNYTLQIADGNRICKTTKIDTICDFRSTDVSLNGQGAPLVPIGDKLLFNEFDVCINLGGIANLSFDKNGTRTAYDICICNMLLNYLANKQGLEYDKSGNLAKEGKIAPDLFNQLNNHEYYQSNSPKSMGIEWFNKFIKSIIDSRIEPVNDLLHTSVLHIAHQIKATLNANVSIDSKILVTGGGTFNNFLIEHIKKDRNYNIVIPSTEIINFKEAIIFAFMGVLRKLNRENILHSVTGAKQNHSAGIIYWAPN